MKIRLAGISLAGIICLIFAPSAFCQEPPSSSITAQEKPGEEDMSWVWGEIKSLDIATSTLTITYMDYQSDEEKELILNTDQQTKFENASGISDIKIGDTASIDYMIKDTKNIAKNISIEKMEELPEAAVMNEPKPETETQEKKQEVTP